MFSVLSLTCHGTMLLGMHACLHRTTYILRLPHAITTLLEAFISSFPFPDLEKKQECKHSADNHVGLEQRWLIRKGFEDPDQGVMLWQLSVERRTAGHPESENSGHGRKQNQGRVYSAVG